MRACVRAFPYIRTYTGVIISGEFNTAVFNEGNYSCDYLVSSVTYRSRSNGQVICYDLMYKHICCSAMIV